MQNLRSKYAANSLMMTLILALIIVTICFSIIVISYYNKTSQLQYISDTKLYDNLESGVNILLADTNFPTDVKIDTLKLFADDEDSTIMQTSIWGIVKYNHLCSFNHLGKKEQSFFSSTAVPDSLNCALFLVDHQRPLNVAKNARIDGVVYLPRAGISEQNNVSQVLGEHRLSGRQLPTFNRELIKCVEKLINKYTINVANRNLAMINQSVMQSFNDSSINISSTGDIELLSGNFSGNIIISSAKTIIINAGVICNNIIIAAPKVVFKDGFTGKLQVFATDSLITGSNCTFEYPSVLYLKKNKNIAEQALLIVGNGTALSGSIICLAEENEYPNIMAEFKQNTFVKGLVYVHGFLDLKSVVYGTVITDFFIYRNDVATFENYFAASLLNRAGLPSFLVPPAGFSSSNRSIIIDWIN